MASRLISNEWIRNDFASKSIASRFGISSLEPLSSSLSLVISGSSWTHDTSPDYTTKEYKGSLARNSVTPTCVFAILQSVLEQVFGKTLPLPWAKYFRCTKAYGPEGKITNLYTYILQKQLSKESEFFENFDVKVFGSENCHTKP